MSQIFHQVEMRGRTGEQRIHGLRGPVDILTDTYGVPHIYAENREDLFFAQGYVTARDRQFQMDYNRHGAQGRLCELLGRKELPWRALSVHLKERTTFDVDIMMRAFGLERTAKASWELASEESRSILTAYTAGVNAFLATYPRTIEHTVLGRKTQPWTEIDSMVMLKAIGFELNYAWRAIFLGAMLADQGLPEHLCRTLWPEFPEHGPTIVDDAGYRRMLEDVAATREVLDETVGVGNVPGVGSNCWAVDAAHSSTGDAILANDTHLVMTAPQPWHEVHLVGDGLDVHGFQLAGVPGVGIGRTPNLSWGITAGLVHDLDLFLEELNPEDPTEYRTPDGWKKLEEIPEVIRIRGERAVEHTLHATRHGPLMETVGTQPDSRYRLAVTWTGHEPANELDALIGMWRAKTLEDADAAMEHLACPNFNIIMAESAGRIGYVLTGRIPKRKPHTPLRPLEGWTGEWDWDGLVPYAENPRDIDPPKGFLVTANNRVGPKDYPHELGQLFEPPERFQRITEVLEKLGSEATFEDFQRLQSDTFAKWGARSRDALLSVVGGIRSLGLERQSVAYHAAVRWESWSGDASADSAGATLAYSIAHISAFRVVRELAGEDAALAFIEMSSFAGPSILELPKVRDDLAACGVDLAGIVRETFHDVVAELLEELGEDLDGWAWGRVHGFVCRHRFHNSPLGKIFSLGPEPCGGGPDTVNRADFNANTGYDVKVGPAMRMIVSAKEQGRAATILPGGQSGRRFSPHYDDQLSMFLRGELKSVCTERDAIDTESVEHWVPGDVE